MATTQAARAKKFKVFLNGDENFQGKPFVLNSRRVPTWDSFLDSVTYHVKSREAVRAICTPTGGTKVVSLEALEDDRNYVAIGRGKFKKLEYLHFGEQQLAKKLYSPRNYESGGAGVNPFEIRPVEHGRIRCSGRIRKIPVDVMTIFVYSNGKELEPARRVTLTHRMLYHWPTILAQITDKVNLTSGACRKLYTLDGALVTSPADLKSFAQYVAVGADVGGFKHLDYGANKPAFNSSPKRDRRWWLNQWSMTSVEGQSQGQGRGLGQRSQSPGLHRKLEPLTFRRRPQQTTSSSEQSGTLEQSLTSTGSSDRSDGSKQKRPPRPTIPRVRRKPPAKKEEESVFHAKPIKHKRTNGREQRVDLDKDEGGVFKAKGQNRETRGAQEVDETRDTRVELPIDQVEAEEVKDEEIEGELNNNNTTKSNTKPKKQTKPKNNSRQTQQKRSPPPQARAPSPHNGQHTPPNRSPQPSDRSPTPKSVRESPAPEPTERSRTGSRTRTPESGRATPVNNHKSETPPPPQSVTPTGRTSQGTPPPRSATPRSEQGSGSRAATPDDRSPTPTQREEKPDSEAEREDPERGEEEEEEEEDEQQKHDAALKIQTSFRGHKARKEYAARKKSAEEEKAAVKIQAGYRGYQTRKDLKEDQKKNAAATKIQANYRGYKTRKDQNKLQKDSGSQATQEEKEE